MDNFVDNFSTVFVTILWTISGTILWFNFRDNFVDNSEDNLRTTNLNGYNRTHFLYQHISGIKNGHDESGPGTLRDSFKDNFRNNFSTYLVRTQCLFGVRGLFPYPLKWAKELVQSIAAFPLSFRYASNVGHQE